MSVWTHVNGNIRFNAIGDIKKELIERLGTPFGYHDFPENPDDYNIPYGSEGSLKYNIWENPNEYCLAKYNVSIWGDLRDYDSYDAENILKWLVHLNALFIRDGIITIKTEGLPHKVYLYADNQWVKVGE